jgi:leucine-zipper-like transcriptional regulator 1
MEYGCEYRKILTPKNPLIAASGDGIWVIGGIGPGNKLLNDIWSSADGEQWQQVNTSTGFSARKGSCAVVFNDTLWVIGGRTQEGGYRPDNSMDKNDVWYSSHGDVWLQATPYAAFPGRTGHQCLVFDNRMWVIGGTALQDIALMKSINGTTSSEGIIKQINFSDVWYSDNGTTWIPATLNASFGPRYNHRAMVFNNEMLVINGKEYNDIWSSTDGKNWKFVSGELPFNRVNGPLETFGFVEYDDKIWVVSSAYNAWYSRDGVIWVSLSMDRYSDYRSNPAVIVFRDRIWVMGGSKKDLTNDIFYTPASGEIKPIRAPSIIPWF